MKVRASMRAGAFGALALLLLASCEVTGAGVGAESTAKAGAALSVDPNADYATVLTGEGSSSGAALSGVVEVYVDDATTARIVVTNTSPEESSTVEGGPVLTRLAFNLAGSPAASCFAVSVPDGRFAFTDRVQPLCGRTPRLGPMFAYGLDAVNPAPHTGIARGESLEFVLTVQAGCTYELSAASFADAGESPSSGRLTQWAAKYQVVGQGGGDSGCAQGDVPPPPEYEFTQSEFSARAAEKWPGVPLPSGANATPAGSVEMNFFGSQAWNGLMYAPYWPPFAGYIAHLRNGAGQVIDSAIGTESGAPNGLITIALPDSVPDSNHGYDDGSLARLTVATEIVIDHDGEPTDNANKWFRITWQHKADPNTGELEPIDDELMDLRVHLDANLNSDLTDDPWVHLFCVNWTECGGFVLPDFVTVYTTATSVTVEVNVQDAHDYAWGVYLDLGYPF